MLQEGDQAAPGLKLERIEQSRTVWSFHGYRYASAAAVGGLGAAAGCEALANVGCGGPLAVAEALRSLALPVTSSGFELAINRSLDDNLARDLPR